MLLESRTSPVFFLQKYVFAFRSLRIEIVLGYSAFDLVGDFLSESPWGDIKFKPKHRLFSTAGMESTSELDLGQ